MESILSNIYPTILVYPIPTTIPNDVGYVNIIVSFPKIYFYYYSKFNTFLFISYIYGK